MHDWEPYVVDLLTILLFLIVIMGVHRRSSCCRLSSGMFSYLSVDKVFLVTHLQRLKGHGPMM